MKNLWIVLLLLCFLLVGCQEQQPVSQQPTSTPAVSVAGEVDFRVYLNRTHISAGETTNIVPVAMKDGVAQEITASFDVADAKIATVDANGVVAALANGSTAIVAKCTVDGKEYVAETTIYVEDNMAVGILQEQLQPALGGGSVRANYNIYYNGEAINAADIVWQIADTGIAKVDESGNVTAVALGETTLILQYKSLEATIPVVVNTKAISTVAEFMAIREDMDLNYVLLNDIDFGGVGMTFGFGDEVLNTRTAFTGTLDGNGFALKNVVIADGPAIKESGSDKTFTIFAENRGTIKNIMFEVEWPTTANTQTRVGIIHNNYGTVENVAFTGKIYANSYWDSGAFSLVNQNYSVMRNCVAVLDVSELSRNQDNWVNLTNRQGDKTARIENCVLIVLGSDAMDANKASLDKYNNGGKFTLGGFFASTNGVTLNSSMHDGAAAFFSAMDDMPDGFGSEWTLAGNVLYYGDEVLLEN